MNAAILTARRALTLLLALGLVACADAGYYTHSDARGDGVYYTADRHSRSRLYDDGYRAPYGWDVGVGFYGGFGYGYGPWWDPWFGAPLVVYEVPYRHPHQWRHRPYGDSRDYAPRAARDQAERAASRSYPARAGAAETATPRGRDWDSNREPRSRDDHGRGRRERD